MTIKKPTQAALALSLGIDKALVTRYKAKGMPVGSIAEAKAWRDAHVRAREAAILPSPAGAAVQGEKAAAFAAILLSGAQAQLDAGESMALMVDALRLALAAVPPDQRTRIQVPAGVLAFLTSDVAEVLQRTSDGSLAGNVIRLEMRRPMLPIDAEEFWYSVAAGEVFLTKDT